MLSYQTRQLTRTCHASRLPADHKLKRIRAGDNCRLDKQRHRRVCLFIRIASINLSRAAGQRRPNCKASLLYIMVAFSDAPGNRAKKLLVITNIRQVMLVRKLIFFLSVSLSQ